MKQCLIPPKTPAPADTTRNKYLRLYHSEKFKIIKCQNKWRHTASLKSRDVKCWSDISLSDNALRLLTDRGFESWIYEMSSSAKKFIAEQKSIDKKVLELKRQEQKFIKKWKTRIILHDTIIYLMSVFTIYTKWICEGLNIETATANYHHKTASFTLLETQMEMRTKSCKLLSLKCSSNQLLLVSACSFLVLSCLQQHSQS